MAIDLDILRTLLGRLEQGLGQCQQAERESIEARLRQEGAVLAVRALLSEGEAQPAPVFVPASEEVTDGGNH